MDSRFLVNPTVSEFSGKLTKLATVYIQSIPFRLSYLPVQSEERMDLSLKKKPNLLLSSLISYYYSRQHRRIHISLTTFLEEVNSALVLLGNRKIFNIWMTYVMQNHDDAERESLNCGPFLFI